MEYDYYDNSYDTSYGESYNAYESIDYIGSNDDYIDSSDLSGLGLVAGFGAVFFIFYFAIMILLIIIQWKVFKKANRPGWHSIIPIYNFWALFEIVGMKGWLSLIPLVNGILIIVAYYKLAKVFGKSGGFGLGLIFFTPIFMAILAFGKAQYINPNGNVMANNMMPNQNPIMGNTPQNMNPMQSMPQNMNPMPMDQQNPAQMNQQQDINNNQTL